MAVTPGQNITQAEMDSLASLANAKLLPNVNGVLTADSSQWFGVNYYSKADSAIPTGLGGSFPIKPQPSYSFTLPSSANLITGSPTFDGSGQYTLTLTADSDYDVILNNASAVEFLDAALGQLYYSGVDQRGVFMKNTYSIRLHGTAGAAVQSVIRYGQEWSTEINRIRADAISLYIGNNGATFNGDTSGLFGNTGLICSGPWCVGVCDSDTYPIASKYSATGFTLNSQSVLFNEFSQTYPASTSSINIAYKSVSFYCTDNDAPNVNALQVMWMQNFFDNGGSAGMYSIPFQTDTAGTWKCQIEIPFDYTGTGQPALSGITITDTSTGATISNWSIQYSNTGGTLYYLVGQINQALTNTSSGTISLNIALAANYAFNTVGSPTSQFYITQEFILQTVSAYTAVNGFHPKYGTVKFDINDFTTIPQLKINGVYAIPAYTISDPTVKGIWVAKTLPVPGNNVFIDQCLPNFVNAKSAGVQNFFGDPFGIAVACSLDTADYTRPLWPPIASRMKTAAPNGSAKIGKATPAICPQSAQWPIYRDTDFLPFNYGFNRNYSATTTNGLSGGTSLSTPVNSLATQIKIRLMQRDSIPGWYSNVFQYGQPLASGYAMYFKINGTATTIDYDFVSLSNEINLPNDFDLNKVKTAAGYSLLVLPPYGLISATIAAQGGGYSAGDVITISGGVLVPGGSAAQITVTSVLGGVITGFYISNAGSYVTAPSSPASTSGGTGSGLQLDCVFSQGAQAYDIYEQIDYDNPLRCFFPPSDAVGNQFGDNSIAECFSYCINPGYPGLTYLQQFGYDSATAYSNHYYSKPIPQSGYCVFKIRATLLPVDNAAGIKVLPTALSDVVIKVGQFKHSDGQPNPFQPVPGMGGGFGMGNITGYGMGGQVGADTISFVPFKDGSGNDYTITIPAGSSSAGDVEVFFPVIGGNEIVWQCATNIKFEAWGNFQPIFFNSQYAVGQFPFKDPDGLWPNDTQIHKYCLKFCNWFDPVPLDWPDYQINPLGYNWRPYRLVQFPLSADIYNDLNTVLSLIP